MIRAFFLFLRINVKNMKCRLNCGACCIAPSISSVIPGMPGGKKAGIACIHLTRTFQCGLYNKPERPEVCKIFRAEPEVCGSSREEAMRILTSLEN
jgi:Fe-S-cluster containining protein